MRGRREVVGKVGPPKFVSESKLDIIWYSVKVYSAVERGSDVMYRVGDVFEEGRGESGRRESE